jgi:hypothetical protein
MMQHRTDRQQTYEPLRDKTLFNVLRQQFVSEFGYANKVIFAEVMIALDKPLPKCANSGSRACCAKLSPKAACWLRTTWPPSA